MRASIDYRPEIDGLRALSILAVVLFHLGLPWLPGGFVGVDVFFVISGFLITSIITGQQVEGTFRLRDFWLRRARRLLPALGTMLLLATLTGYLSLVGTAFESLGLQAVSALTFWANICMYRSAGNYWGPEAEDFPLLHCWSLSVEEQFYLLFPITIVLLSRLGRRRMLWTLIVVGLASFGAAIFGSQRFPAAAFYLLPTRAWELLIGCLLALGQERIRSRGVSPAMRGILADLGLAMIAASFLVVRRGGWFPAPSGLLPTFGAALLIGFGQDAGWSRRLLSLRPVVYLGRISYSWYLMHWPVIMLGRLMGIDDPGVLFSAGLTLGIASYHLVEIPTRKLPEIHVLPRIVVPVIGVGILAFVIPRLHLRGRGDHDIPTHWCTADVVPWKQEWGDKPGCVSGGFTRDWKLGVRQANRFPGPDRVVILGDSHAKSWLPGLDAALNQLGWNYTAFPASATSPFFVRPSPALGFYGRSDLWKGTTRVELDQNRLAYLTNNQPPIAVIGARWFTHRNWERSDFDAGISNLLAILPNSQILFLGQPPELRFGSEGFERINGEIGIFTQYYESKTTTAIRQKLHNWIKDYAAREPRMRFIETEQFFRNGDQIRLFDGRKTLYRDDDHISVEGAMRMTNFFRTVLLELDAAHKVSKP